MCLAQGQQRSDAGEARTCGPSVSSQALYDWATALPNEFNKFNNTGAQMLDCTYHMTLKLFKNRIFGVKTLRLRHILRMI